MTRSRGSAARTVGSSTRGRGRLPIPRPGGSSPCATWSSPTNARERRCCCGAARQGMRRRTASTCRTERLVEAGRVARRPASTTARRSAQTGVPGLAPLRREGSAVEHHRGRLCRAGPPRGPRIRGDRIVAIEALGHGRGAPIHAGRVRSETAAPTDGEAGSAWPRLVERARSTRRSGQVSLASLPGLFIEVGGARRGTWKVAPQAPHWQGRCPARAQGKGRPRAAPSAAALPALGIAAPEGDERETPPPTFGPVSESAFSEEERLPWCTNPGLLREQPPNVTSAQGRGRGQEFCKSARGCPRGGHVLHVLEPRPRLNTTTLPWGLFVGLSLRRRPRRRPSKHEDPRGGVLHAR